MPMPSFATNVAMLCGFRLLQPVCASKMLSEPASKSSSRSMGLKMSPQIQMERCLTMPMIPFMSSRTSVKGFAASRGRSTRDLAGGGVRRWFPSLATLKQCLVNPMADDFLILNVAQANIRERHCQKRKVRYYTFDHRRLWCMYHAGCRAVRVRVARSG